MRDKYGEITPDFDAWENKLDIENFKEENKK